MQDGGVSNTGALPYLKRMMQFSWQELAAGGRRGAYRPATGRGVPVSEFQDAMKAAQVRQRGRGLMPAVARGHGAFADTRRSGSRPTASAWPGG